MVRKLSVSGNAVTIHRVVSGVDCATVLNPNLAANNIDGGIAWGLGSAFRSELTFDRGRDVQSNFHDYQVLRLSEVPPVEVFHWEWREAIARYRRSRAGDRNTCPDRRPVAATGQRYRSLPLSRHGLRIA